ncbi:DinB family protein [Brachybacterium sp. FME24]|uniref:DinB family protein n=1 Tax=Brachybacterium sp. FME24 TaxID=2742605 RepID=UPI0018660D00|nr:DinB family protein [Brachybacterium sp. FME24]
MTSDQGQSRPEPPLAADEVATLVGFLEYQRATIAWKCSGLENLELNMTVGPSTMTLGGLLKHLAYYEDHWFSHHLRGNPRKTIWDAVNWDAEPDWEWTSAAEDSPETLRALWSDAVSQSRCMLGEALAEGGLGVLAGRGLPDGRVPTARWILVHMIEEYARHNGHADLIRESVDGLIGE